MENPGPSAFVIIHAAAKLQFMTSAMVTRVARELSLASMNSQLLIRSTRRRLGIAW
jgi:hypothetical protein